MTSFNEVCFSCLTYTVTIRLNEFNYYYELLSEHFLCNNHNATDMQLIPLELVQCNRDSVRKAREVYLIERGQTLEPQGLNKKDET